MLFSLVGHLPWLRSPLCVKPFLLRKGTNTASDAEILCGQLYCPSDHSNKVRMKSFELLTGSGPEGVSHSLSAFLSILSSILSSLANRAVTEVENSSFLS